MVGEALEELNPGLLDAATTGHALFRSEVTTVGLLAQLLSDFGIARVVDLSPPSGAGSSCRDEPHRRQWFLLLRHA